MEAASLSPCPVEPPRQRASRRVIVAGYGPVGRVVAEQLIDAGFNVTIIETNPETVQRQRRMGKTIVQGDARDPAVLEAAGVHEAEALILAVPDEDVALAACQVARELSPDIFISARTNFVSKGLLATRAGADHVTVEEVVTAEAMRSAVMAKLRERTAFIGQGPNQ